MQPSALLLCFSAFLVLLYVYPGDAVTCFDCNSHEQPECALDIPPDIYKRDCSEKGSKYSMCRKITQVIEFEVNGMPPDNRVIRGCGWDDSSYKGKCYQRSGFGGRQEVCSCLTDLCNGAPQTSVSKLSAAAAVFVAVIIGGRTFFF